jgi:type I restriction-modification system DNA methylase subunit
MLAELAERRPLQRGMRVLDPACGSGAFLVQCYRRLIEREFPPGTTPQPAALRELLVKHIYGVDVEEDACNVAELSLILTLLDYVEPPDLEDHKRGFP